MDNTQKKKKKINIPLLLMTIGFISIIGYFLYNFVYEPLKDISEGEKGNIVLQQVEDGTVYVYSEEEKQAFREAAAKYREEKIAQKDLKPGDAVYGPKYEDMIDIFKEYGVEEQFPEFEPERAYFIKYLTHDVYQRFLSSDDKKDNEEICFTANTVRPGNIFDENLKLKNPEIFYGFTSTTKPMFEGWQYVGEKDFGFLNGNDAEETFKYFVKTLKNLDRDYKDSKELNSVFNEVIKYDGNYVFSFEPKLEAALNINCGPSLITSYKYNQNYKENSTNPFHRLLRSHPKGFENFGGHFAYNFNEKMELTDVDFFPQEYNYFIDKENFYIDFIPSKITKFNEKTYMVDIEVNKPLDRTALTILMNNFYFRFNQGYMPSIEYDNAPLDLSIRITHKNLSNEMLEEYGIYQITPRSIVKRNNNEMKSSVYKLTPLNWYPNEEAQVWVKEYFSLAKEAFDNDSRFSMFETMHQLADKYGVSHKTMESVICSYYYTFIIT